MNLFNCTEQNKQATNVPNNMAIRYINTITYVLVLFIINKLASQQTRLFTITNLSMASYIRAKRMRHDQPRQAPPAHI